MAGTNGSAYEYDDDPMVLTNAQIQFLGENTTDQQQPEVNPGTTNEDVFPWDVPAGVHAATVTIDSGTGTGTGTGTVSVTP
jgi:hypothetical protein